MKTTTLIFLKNTNNQLLLGMKKRGFGINKRNGFGGKCQEDETIIASALRELQEESDIFLNSEDLKEMGTVTFLFPDKPERDQECHIFSGKYNGSFKETEEMIPQRRDLDKIPYDEMREDDKFWLPKLIAEENFDITFHFDVEGKMIQ